MFDVSAIEKIKTKKIYSIEGNIGAGKSTILKIIGKQIKDVELVEEPVEEWKHLGGMNLLDSFYQDPKRWGFTFEFYSMFSKMRALLNAANTDKPVIIIERSIFSNKIFIDTSKELGKLEPMEYRMLMNTMDFYLQHIYPQLSGIIYLDTPVDECLKRIIKRNRGEETSIERDYLELIKGKIDELANSSGFNIFRVNGEYDCERDAIKVCEDIKGFMHPNESPKAAIAY